MAKTFSNETALDKDGPRNVDYDLPTRSFWRVNYLYVRFCHGLKVHGSQNIPKNGPVILASNHTAGLDPCLIQAACSRVIRWVMLTSYRFAFLEPLWRVIQPIALERTPDAKGSTGGGDLAKIRQLVRILKAGDIIGLFPEGGLQRTQRELQPFEPGIGLIARRSGAAIVPVWIAGTPRRQNMLWHFLQPSRSSVTFGPSFTPDKSQSDEQIVETLRQRMMELAKRTV